MRNIAFFLACLFIVAGVAIIFWPAAFICAGLLVGALTFLSEF